MIVFDEKKHAEKMLRKGFFTKNRNVYELYILCKYYYSIGYDESKVKDELIKFCRKYVEYFNLDEWYKIINKTVQSAKNGSLIEGKEIHITKKELDTIQKLEKLNEQKVAFVLLVLYKFYNCRKFEVTIEDIYRLAKLNINSKTKLQILQTLTSNKYIDINMNGRRWVKFADNKGNSEITVRDYDDVVYEFLRYIGEGKFGDCDKCGKIIKMTSSTKKYCNNCKRLKDLEKYKNYNKKRQPPTIIG